MDDRADEKKKLNTSHRFKRFGVLLMVGVMILSLYACKGETAAATPTPQEMNITGEYQGFSTVTEAKNDSLGTVKDMTFRIVQNNNGTAAMTINDNTVEGTYDPATGKFSMEQGFLWALTFAPEGDTITAKGTMTSEETGDGFTQEITLELEKVSD